MIEIFVIIIKPFNESCNINDRSVKDVISADAVANYCYSQFIIYFFDYQIFYVI